MRESGAVSVGPAAMRGSGAESGAVSDQTQTTAQITMQARTLGARTDVSRLLLLE